MKAIVVIPIYKQFLTDSERAVLIQCCKILNKHDFSLVYPRGLNIAEHLKLLDGFNVRYQLLEFDKSYFDGIHGYNLLMLNVDFYKRFVAYDYMLIYQLDAYVFRDDLIHWCEQGYDFIGAPWNRFDFLRNKLHLLHAGVNGGFSLRSIVNFIKVLSDEKIGKKILEDFIRGGRNEDGFYSVQAKRIDPAFKVAPFSMAMSFSFEVKPDRLFKLTNRQLPFGCHAWQKYDPVFWESYIKQ